MPTESAPQQQRRQGSQSEFGFACHYRSSDTPIGYEIARGHTPRGYNALNDGLLQLGQRLLQMGQNPLQMRHAGAASGQSEVHRRPAAGARDVQRHSVDRNRRRVAPVHLEPVPEHIGAGARDIRNDHVECGSRSVHQTRDGTAQRGSSIERANQHPLHGCHLREHRLGGLHRVADRTETLQRIGLIGRQVGEQRGDRVPRVLVPLGPDRHRAHRDERLVG